MFFGLFSKKKKVHPQLQQQKPVINENGKRPKLSDSNDNLDTTLPIGSHSAKHSKVTESKYEIKNDLSVSMHSPVIKENTRSKVSYSPKELFFFRQATTNLTKSSETWSDFVGRKINFDLNTLDDVERQRQNFCYQAYVIETNYWRFLHEGNIDPKLEDISSSILARFSECFRKGLVNKISHVYSEALNDLIYRHAYYLGDNPEPSSFQTAYPHAYSCLLAEIVGGICRYTSKDHVDFAPLSTVYKSIRKLVHLAPLCKEIYTIQIPHLSTLLNNVIDYENLLFSIFDWSYFSKISLDSLLHYSNSLAEFKAFNFWSIQYDKKITQQTKRQKMMLLLFMHGCVLIDMEYDSYQIVVTKFTPLRDIQITCHFDPNVQYGFCAKFNLDNKVFLLEAMHENVFNDFTVHWQKFNQYWDSLCFDNFTSTTNITESIDSSTESYTHAKNRPQILSESMPFLLNSEHCSSEIHCKLLVYVNEEKRWANKNLVKMIFYANDEHFPFINFYLEETGVILYSLWLSRIIRFEESNQKNLFIWTDSDKLMLKFSCTEMLDQFIRCVANLRGDSQEKGIFSCRPTSKFTYNAFAMSKYKFFCFPVLLVGTDMGILTIDNSNGVSFGALNSIPLWTALLDNIEILDCSKSYISQRHVQLENKVTKEIVCFAFKTVEYLREFCNLIAYLKDVQEHEKTALSMNNLVI